MEDILQYEDRTDVLSIVSTVSTADDVVDDKYRHKDGVDAEAQNIPVKPVKCK